MESNQTLVTEEEENQLNFDDNRADEAEEEEQQQRGECGDHGNAEPQTSSSVNGKEILQAIEVVERDSMAIAHSYTSRFASLWSALSEVTITSVDHMKCFGDAAGRVQECALDAATKGNRYINSSLRLNEAMKGVDILQHSWKEEKNQLNSDDNKAVQDGEEEQQQGGECGDHGNAESQISSSVNGKEILKAAKL